MLVSVRPEVNQSRPGRVVSGGLKDDRYRDLRPLQRDRDKERREGVDVL